MKRFAYILLLAGCLNAPPSALNIEELRELENTGENDIIYTPGLDYEEPAVDLPPLMSYEPCICAYYSWRERGLICVGLVCTDSCPTETRTCNESRRACIQEYP